MTKCAICGKPAIRGAVVDRKRGVDAYPFCSFRCQTIDLGKWLNEEYRIPDDTPVSTEADQEDTSASRRP